MTPLPKQPHRNRDVLDQVEGLMGTAAMAMLHQQGAMREAAVWQVKVEDAMRELARVLEEDRDL